MGLRELIWGLIAALAAYVLLQLARARAGGRAAASEAGAADDAALVSPADDDPEARADDAAPRERAERIALELELQQLRRDLGQLRAEQAEQRRQHALLADTVAEMGEALATVQAGQRISPQYGEAVMLARRGLESEAIAERCGISVAEAALVRSLSAQGGNDKEAAGGG